MKVLVCVERCEYNSNLQQIVLTLHITLSDGRTIDAIPVGLGTWPNSKTDGNNKITAQTIDMVQSQFPSVQITGPDILIIGGFA